MLGVPVVEDAGEEGGPSSQNREISSKVVQIEMKRIYIDLKANDRGSFCRLSEIDISGARSKIVCPLAGIEDFKSHLTLFSNLCAELDATGFEVAPEQQTQPLRTESLRIESKLFFFDLRANARGKFLKISQVMGPRSTVVIPASGIATIRDCITSAMEEGGENIPTTTEMRSVQEQGGAGARVKKELKVENKRFFFDMGTNVRGTFLRISELTGANRASITIPQSGWEQMREVIDECLQRAQNPAGGAAGAF